MENNNSTKKKPIPFKRIIAIILMIGGLITGLFFSSRYVADNSNLGPEYGGGIRFTVKAYYGDDKSSKLDDEDLKKAENNIYDRIKTLGYQTPQIVVLKSSNEVDFQITQPGITTASDADNFVSQITTKSRLSLYGISDSGSEFPVFSANSVNTDKKPEDPNSQELSIKTQYDIVKPGTAAYTQYRNGSSLLNTVGFQLNGTVAETLFATASNNISSADTSKVPLANHFIWWVNRQAFENLATSSKYKDDYAAAGNNLYNFAHVYKNGPDGKPQMTSELKTTPFNAKQYLIADAPAQANPTGNMVYVPNSFLPDNARSIAAQINYGSSNYTLNSVDDSHKYSFIKAPNGATAINHLFIVGMIILAIVALLLIGRYGLLGLVSTLAFGVFTILTLTIFTALDGEYTSLTVSALIFGIALLVDTCILTFEKFKRELYEGKSAKRSLKAANQTINSSIFDSSFILLIIAFIIFYAGTQSLPSFSVILVISVFLLLGLLYLFIKLFAWIIVNWSPARTKHYLVGNYKKFQPLYKKSHEKLEEANYVGKGKWAIFGSLTVVVAGIVAFGTLAGIGGSVSKGINSNQEISGGVQVVIKREDIDPKNYPSATPWLPDQAVNDINKIMNEDTYKNQILSVDRIYQDENQTHINEIDVFFNKSYNPLTFINNVNSDISKYFGQGTGAGVDRDSKLDVNNYSFVNEFAKSLIKTAIIAAAIAFLAIVIYILLRFRWTFSIAMLIAFIHDGLIITAVFILLQLSVSPLFIIGLIVGLLYSLFNKVHIFQSMKNTIQNEGIKNITDYQQIVNRSIGQTFYRNMLMYIMMVAISVTLVVIPNAVDHSFALALLVGIIISIFSTIVLFPFLWVWFEKRRHNSILKAEKVNRWKTEKQEEQTFVNINDIKGI